LCRPWSYLARGCADLKVTLGTIPQVTTATQVSAGTKAIQGVNDVINSVNKPRSALSVKGTQYLGQRAAVGEQHTC
jgi:hypothetical protein